MHSANKCFPLCAPPPSSLFDKPIAKLWSMNRTESSKGEEGRQRGPLTIRRRDNFKVNCSFPRQLGAPLSNSETRIDRARCRSRYYDSAGANKIASCGCTIAEEAAIHANGRRTRGNAIRLGYRGKMLRTNGTVTSPPSEPGLPVPSGNNIRFHWSIMSQEREDGSSYLREVTSPFAGVSARVHRTGT